MKTENDAVSRLISFLEEYVRFFEETAEAETQQYQALLEHDLKKIQATLSSQQAILLQTENLEKRRMCLQEEAGLAGMSLKDVTDSLTDGEQSRRTAELLARLTQAVNAIRTQNARSMQLAEERVKLIDRITEPGGGDSGPYSPSGKGGRGERDGSSSFQMKI